MRNRDERNPEKHHIVPRSKRGDSGKGNIAIILQGAHIKYHRLFENRTPEQILEYLCNYFWKSQKGSNGEKFLINYLRKKGRDI